MWDWIVDWGVWIVAGALLFVGLVGTIVPFLPGHLFIMAGALIPFFALDDSGGLELWGILTMAGGMILAQGFELLSGALGTRWFGGTKWGAVGALAGGIVGIFFMPFGLILGPLAGAFIGEWGFAKQKIRPATVSGVGSVVGTLTGLVVNVVVGVLMVAIFLADIFIW